MKYGTVKFFNASKGVGFITEDDSDTEHFVHVTGLIDEINEGDAVEFELKEGRKGMNAVNVRVLKYLIKHYFFTKNLSKWKGFFCAIPNRLHIFLGMKTQGLRLHFQSFSHEPKYHLGRH